MSNTKLSNRTDSTNLDKQLLILEKLYTYICTEIRRKETKSVCLTKQNYLKQNFTRNSPATNIEKEPHELMAKNEKCKMLKVQ